MLFNIDGKTYELPDHTKTFQVESNNKVAIEFFDLPEPASALSREGRVGFRADHDE